LTPAYALEARECAGEDLTPARSQKPIYLENRTLITMDPGGGENQGEKRTEKNLGWGEKLFSEIKKEVHGKVRTKKTPSDTFIPKRNRPKRMKKVPRTKSKLVRKRRFITTNSAENEKRTKQPSEKEIRHSLRDWDKTGRGGEERRKS